MSTAYAYGRVSTSRQDMSIQAQSQQCQGYFDYRLKANGIAWGGWFADKALSGRTEFLKRENANLMWSRVSSGDHIIIAKMDRGFRNARDLLSFVEQCKARKITLHFID